MSGPHYRHSTTEIFRTHFSTSRILGIRPGMMEQRATRKLLEFLRIFSPMFLLSLFIGAHMVTTITTVSGPKDGSLLRMGTDCRQLPQCSKATGASYKRQRFLPETKRVFSGLSAVILLTYFGDAAVCVAHVAMTRFEWWCGQSVVVRGHSSYEICAHEG